MSQTIGILVDDTADFPEHFMKSLDIHQMPIHIIDNQDDYRTGITIDKHTVIEKVKQNKNLKTTPPLPSEYADVYETMLKKYDKIISLHVSSEISGCFQSALNSLNLLYGDDSKRIKVIDTKNVSIGQALLVKRAHELIRNKKITFEKFDTVFNYYIENSFLSFTVEKLTWLKRGGRINTVSAFLGNMLNVFPIISLENGKLNSTEKIKGKSDSLEQLIHKADEISQKYDRSVDVWVAHADAQENVEYIRDQLANRLNFPIDSIAVVDIGATISIYTGPGGIGISILPK